MWGQEHREDTLSIGTTSMVMNKYYEHHMFSDKKQKTTPKPKKFLMLQRKRLDSALAV